ncbi:HD domain-containing protein [Azohydromonas caseinilytica]|uniref:N-methyl-D-aspartate receptor NMDAR2C subunit n=1 Tax=Azohydromonas caseinilytica TaxID=2728836 RepID=A0A848FE43_9BURK|nr:N-methyl-D-aspartate receptor NMDAR2C subunit [Azohydromonas caseinilytica]NML17704.1 N-methyl-D-aspartate receptor NMDAR2C subunit [Azohydromonas caseinilytica]
MDELLSRSWQRAWGAVSGAEGHALRDALAMAYACGGRHYHTLQHLRETVALLEPALPLAWHPAEVEVALWFHDAVYDPRAGDNEARSAEWAREALGAAGVDAVVGGRVAALILATRHEALPATPDARLLLDADLAILGATPARFDEYERQVRQEYAWVPEERFRTGRRALLQRLLERPALYATDHFRQRFEAPARANLARSLARLAGSDDAGRGAAPQK